LRDNVPGAVIQPDVMAVRIRFESVAGLDALEQQLRFLREEHFGALPREDEMDLLREEVKTSLDKMLEFRRGNTALMEALMLALPDIADGAESKASARTVLTEAGMLDENGALNWPALAQRKAAPMTWEQAVRMFVKQPAEVERLLAMADEPA
jgi:hypothetical protein